MLSNDFQISAKDFALKINSTCIYSLCDLLQHSWTALKSHLHTDRLTEAFAIKEKLLLEEKLSSLIAEIKHQLYIATFALELIRAYVAILVPLNEYVVPFIICFLTHIYFNFSMESVDQQLQKTPPLQSSGTSAHKLNTDIARALKHLTNDPEEHRRIAMALVAISSLLTSILSNPIQISNVVRRPSISAQNKHYFRNIVHRNLNVLHRLNNFFIDECHQTFLACTYAFFPSGMLKWSSLCSLLLHNISSEDGNSVVAGEQQLCSCDSGQLWSGFFSNRQLYLLSAVIKAFCANNLLLVSFFPTFKSTITDSYDNYLSEAKEEQQSPGSGI